MSPVSPPMAITIRLTSGASASSAAATAIHAVAAGKALPRNGVTSGRRCATL